jgi:HprK-related kinase A
VKVSDLTSDAFAAALGRGLRVRLGPFVVHWRVTVPAAHGPMHALYAHHPLAPDEPPDVYVDCRAHLNPRRPWSRRVHLSIDGRFHAAQARAALSVPALEWTMNWSLATRAHEYLMLHAAVVARDGLAVILPAPPGSGKSTLCGALVARGWRLMSDEFTLIRPEDGLIAPLPRPVSLKQGAIAVMRRFAPDHMFAGEFPGTAKGTIGYVVPPAASVAAQDVPAQPHRIVFPRWGAAETVRAEPLSRTETFLTLNRNAVNYSILGERGAALLAGLAADCPAHRLHYDSLDDAVAAVGGLAA